MDLRLNDEQQMFRNTASEFAQKVVAPIAEEVDRTGELPMDVFKKMGDVDFWGILTPPPFGGLGLERIDYALVVKELATVSAAVALGYTESVSAAFVIQAFGSDEQKRKYLPDLAKGKKIAALASTEPSGGSNWHMTVETKAVLDGDNYIVNGRKSFISNAGKADIYITLLRTNPAKGPMGMSLLIIEKDAPGFSIGTFENKMGLIGHQNGELIFDNCIVPKENLLGNEGDPLGKIIPAYGLLHSVGHAAISAGIARASLNAAIKYVKERKVITPMSLANFDGVQTMIAEMAIDTEAAELLAYRCAFSMVKDGPDPVMFMTPTKCNEIAKVVADKAITLHGGSGCTKDFPVERYYRDARTLTFVSAIWNYHRILVGRQLLGVPLGGPPPGAGGPPPGAGGPPRT